MTEKQRDALALSLRERAKRAGKRGYYDSDTDALRGEAIREALEEMAAAVEALPVACCARDHDEDGNCDVHPQPRRRTCPSCQAEGWPPCSYCGAP